MDFRLLDFFQTKLCERSFCLGDEINMLFAGVFENDRPIGIILPNGRINIEATRQLKDRVGVGKRE